MLLAHQTPLLLNTSAIYEVKFRCEEEIPSHNYILEIQGERIFLSQYDTDTLFRPGDSLLVRGRIIPIPGNANPGEFSFNQYLKQKGIHYKIIPSTPIQITGNSSSVRSVFWDLRQSLLQKTATLFPDTTTRTLVNALCLGYKNDLDKDTQELFIRTGTIHLLAVSGLHTGAVYLILTYFLSLLGISSRKTDFITLPILWAYACLTGLSPSVIRAATILSFIAAGKILDRDYTPLNAIAASAFFTLLTQPHLVYSVSFLMSYSAYTGIVTIYPYLNRLPGKLSPIPAKLWALCCISLAAQLPTLPLSAYYFHSVNINGFLINLIAIPVATMILYVSLILLILPLFISVHLTFIVTFLSKTLLTLLHLFRPFSFNIESLYPTAAHLFLLYFNLILIFNYLLKRNKNRLRTSITGLCIFLLFCCAYNLFLSSRKEIIVLNRYQKTAILLNYNGYYSFLKNTLSDTLHPVPYLLKYKLKPLPRYSGLLDTTLLYTENTLRTRNLTISIADENTSAFSGKGILIITRNVTPDKIFTHTSAYPSRLIADASNSWITLKKWEKFCKEQNIIFQNTMESGSISIPLK